MSNVPEPLPPQPGSPPSHRPRRRVALRVAFAVSLVLNCLLLAILGTLLCGALVVGYFRGAGSESLTERDYAGKPDARDKIAIVRIDGVIMEGMTHYAQKQLEQAGTDNHVKAVILRINSPGGTITASDDLHRRIRELREGNPDKRIQSKRVVVSMASMAASGGYYIAVPAEVLFAERTTVTGSIGVYASFPNVKGLADRYGVRMDVIKDGEVKDSGSPFKDMTPQERQLWQDMVDSAYGQFLAVVKEGRGDRLKFDLREVLFTRKIPDRGPDGNVLKQDGKVKEVEYQRWLADGGIFTAEEAKKYQLIDQIGYLDDDAVQEARKLAGLGQDYRVVEYERPPSLLGSLLGIEAR